MDGDYDVDAWLAEEDAARADTYLSPVGEGRGTPRDDEDDHALADSRGGGSSRVQLPTARTLDFWDASTDDAIDAYAQGAELGLGDGVRVQSPPRARAAHVGADGTTALLAALHEEDVGHPSRPAAARGTTASTVHKRRTGWNVVRLDGDADALAERAAVQQAALASRILASRTRTTTLAGGDGLEGHTGSGNVASASAPAKPRTYYEFLQGVGTQKRPTPGGGTHAQFLHTRPPGEHSLQVVLPDGRMYFLQRRAEASMTAASSHAVTHAVQKRLGSLLPVSILQLSATLASEEARALLAQPTLTLAARGTAAHAHTPASDAVPARAVTSGVSAGGVATGGAQGRGEQPVASSLWVDKYAPRTFADLLSSEVVNRNVLKWVRLWHPRVFGTAPAAGDGVGVEPLPKRAAMTAFTAHGAAGGSAGGNNATIMRGGSGSCAHDARARSTEPFFGYGWRPDARVLMLAGPPGMGKTTLAHIVAKHAGYRPVEINASDERTGDSLRERIINEQSMASVFGDKRPALIILDEIDGVDGAGVAELVKMIQVTPSPMPQPASSSSWNDARRSGSGGKDEAGGEGAAAADSDSDAEAGGAASGPSTSTSTAAAGGGGGSHRKRRRGDDGASKETGMRVARGKRGEGSGEAGGAARPLTRPLICICNDKYAPSLRELRQHVQIVDCGRTSADRLAARLKAIAAAEGMSLTSDAASTLVELTDNDVRSCLNTLQFIKFQAAALGGAGSAPPAAPAGGAAALAAWHDPSMPIRVTPDMILRAAVGVKDQTKALYDVWSAVLCRPDARHRRGGSAAAVGAWSTIRSAASTASAAALGVGAYASGGGTHTYVADLHEQLMAYTSETRLLLAGLHENGFSESVPDVNMTHHAAAAAWLSYGDMLTARGGIGSGAALLKYVPTVGVALHAHLAQESKPKLRWPRLDNAMRAALDGSTNVVHSFLAARASSPTATALNALSTSVVVMDVAAPLLSILSPPLRPVNFTLLNSREKRDLNVLVDTLVSLGMTYASSTAQREFEQERRGASYKLTPDIQRLVEFEGYDPWDADTRTPLADIVRQIVAQEVRKARIRAMHAHADKMAAAMLKGGDEDMAAPTSPPGSSLPQHVRAQLDKNAASGAKLLVQQSSVGVPDVGVGTAAGAGAGEAPAGVAVSSAAASSNFMTDAANKARRADAAHRRHTMAQQAAEKASTRTGGSAPPAGVRNKYPVVYRYQEGFTNAVRRPVRLVDFL